MLILPPKLLLLLMLMPKPTIFSMATIQPTTIYGYGWPVWGRKKRDADSAPEAAPTADADAEAYYLLHGYYPANYHSYGYGWPVWGRKRRDADAAPTPDADAEAYYLLHGYYPAYYHSYGWPVWGRKRRDADSAPEAAPAAEADADSA